MLRYYVWYSIKTIALGCYRSQSDSFVQRIPYFSKNSRYALHMLLLCLRQRKLFITSLSRSLYAAAHAHAAVISGTGPQARQ